MYEKFKRHIMYMYETVKNIIIINNNNPLDHDIETENT